MANHGIGAYGHSFRLMCCRCVVVVGCWLLVVVVVVVIVVVVVVVVIIVVITYDRSPCDLLALGLSQARLS